MYLSELKLWNFRKFGSSESELEPGKPDLVVPLKKGLNVLIGENDSGKSSIIDAIKIVLNTHSSEWIHLSPEDFHVGTKRLRIECRFDQLSDHEAMHFTEWLGVLGEDSEAALYLRVFIDATLAEEKVLPYDIRAGVDEDGYRLNAEAREYLKSTYLRPLRDAKSELMPGRNSRLSQILVGHEAFKGQDKSHYLVKKGYGDFKKAIMQYFTSPTNGDKQGKQLKDKLDTYLKHFFGGPKATTLHPPDRRLKDILDLLRLSLEEDNLGLGSHNLLFIAAELLNLERSGYTGLRLGLIEELEAHLHPQAQLRVITYLKQLADQETTPLQFVLTTHSPNLGSKVPLESLIMCSDTGIIPMGTNEVGESCTKLTLSDHKFLERFLDVTKANLFFARGVILVEGWAEEMIMPALAQKIGSDLTKHGVSVVNIGSTAFLRYARVFQRQTEPHMDIPVAIVTDLDVRPDQEGQKLVGGDTRATSARQGKQSKYEGQTVEVFVSPHWTLEYCLSLSDSVGNIFLDSVCTVHTSVPKESVKHWLTEALEGKHKIQKGEIAQTFAEKLLTDEVSAKELRADSMIKYLVEAIDYACRKSPDN